MYGAAQPPAFHVRTIEGESLTKLFGGSTGATAEESGQPRVHHSPTFDFDERALAIAARLLAGYARDAAAAPVISGKAHVTSSAS